MNRRIVMLAVAAGLLGFEVHAQESPRPSILVLAAASTTNAIDEIRKEFTLRTGVEVKTSYAASSTLAQQVAHGAEADLFVSADQKWADFLAEKDLIAQRRNLLGNRLVVIAPKDSALKLAKLEDLVHDDMVQRLALGDPQGVPAGRYAKQAFTKLGLWEQIQGKVVPAEDVRHALTFVETSAAEAGIVYATDAALSKKTKVAFVLPADLTDPIRYPVALLRHGEDKNGPAEAFYRYLGSAVARSIFQKYGFTVLAEGDEPAPAGK